MKYVLQKGFRGFADRLKHLMLCLKIALDTNRKVVIDWSDYYWNHNGESFYTYFELKDSIESIKNCETLSTYPSFWQSKLAHPLTHEMFIELSKIKNIFNNHITFITNKLDKQEDVIVIDNRCHFTLTNLQFFVDRFRVKDERILSRIKKINDAYNLSTCIGVHLRGTDRKIEKTKNSVLISEITKKISKTDTVVCVTDELELFNDFKKVIPRAILLTNLLITEKNKGTHKIKSENLQFTKDEMNVDLIVDFFILALCKKSYSTFNESLFYTVSVLLRPHAKTILKME
jgi:hypothetical protein